MQYSTGVVLVKGSKALMQLRDNISGIVLPGYWSIPGGQRQKGETLEEAAKREFFEETGYILRNPQLFKVEVYKVGGKQIKRHLFWEVYDGKQGIFCYEGQKMEFRSPKNFPRMKIYPRHAEFIKEAIELTSRG